MKLKILFGVAALLAACSSKPPPEVALRSQLPENTKKNHFRIGQSKSEVQTNMPTLGNCTGPRNLEICEVRVGADVRHLTFENQKLVRWDEDIESGAFMPANVPPGSVYSPLKNSTTHNKGSEQGTPPR